MAAQEPTRAVQAPDRERNRVSSNTREPQHYVDPVFELEPFPFGD